MPVTTAPFFLLHPVSSLTQARIFSQTAITVENAANVMNRKNMVPQIRPPSMELNTAAIVLNRSAGPSLTSRPSEVQAGKMIIPDMIATKVSRTMTFTDSPMRERSLPI